MRYLACMLNEDIQTLRSLANDIACHYDSWQITNDLTGKTRTIKVPDKKLKRVQTRILRKILDHYTMPEFVHGAVKGRSPRTHANSHCGSPFVVTVDIKSFFPSISHKLVAKMFKSVFDCGRDVTWLLTRLTTIDGQLPQGAPTSAAIANIVLAESVDQQIQEYAQSLEVNFSRFVDDYAFSGIHARLLITEIGKLLSRLNLSIGRSNAKLHLMPASRRQEVTGLNVNLRYGPSVPRTKRDRIRSAIRQLPELPAANLPQALPSVRGRINYVAQFNRGSARRLEQLLEGTLREVKRSQVSLSAS